MCPVCAESMLVLEFEGIDIDRCDRCGGTWLDSGELTLLLERRGSYPDQLHDALNRGAEGKPTRARCPRCRGRLREVCLGDPEIRLAECPRGHGIWCGRVEMSLLLGEFGRRSVIAGFLSELGP